MSVRRERETHIFAALAPGADDATTSRRNGDGTDLSEFGGRVSDPGEGRWTLKAAIDEGVPAPVVSTALPQRFASRGDEDFANNGATGDLAHKKIFPALQGMVRHSQLNVPVIEAEWRIVAPILASTTPPHEYQAGTWGPVEADRLIDRSGGWHQPQPAPTRRSS